MQSSLDSLIGRKIQRIERLQYCYKGEAGAPSDDVQLWFEDRVLRLRVGGNGQRLEMTTDPWTDVFAGPLDPSNLAYIAEHGRFVLSDVSKQLGYADAIEASLLSYDTRSDPDGEITGVTLHFDTITMHLLAEFDELEVSWSPRQMPDAPARASG